jgi:hypothetical protein
MSFCYIYSSVDPKVAIQGPAKKKKKIMELGVEICGAKRYPYLGRTL